jgi:ABC-type siderophore export system fused ATPase/permease subunit
MSEETTETVVDDKITEADKALIKAISGVINSDMDPISKSLSKMVDKKCIAKLSFGAFLILAWMAFTIFSILMYAHSPSNTMYSIMMIGSCIVLVSAIIDFAITFHKNMSDCYDRHRKLMDKLTEMLECAESIADSIDSSDTMYSNYINMMDNKISEMHDIYMKSRSLENDFCKKWRIKSKDGNNQLS